MNVLGIETSCDETSVAVINNGKLSSNIIASQDFHKDFGGVVPELSSRAHLQLIVPLLKQAIAEAELNLKDIDVISATAGPGLIGALLVGLTFAKGLSLSIGKPFIPVNHIEGHIYSGFLMDDKPEFPYLCLVVSGGHTLLLYVESDVKFYKLGTTIDDAAGEAFDKVSKMIGLGYPGGPLIQKNAEIGDENKIDFPIAKLKTDYDFSFSGVKTSVLRYIEKTYNNQPVPKEDLQDIAASFQKSVIGALVKNVEKALQNYKVKSISVVGGVAANKYLGEKLKTISKKYNKKLIIPGIQFCGDNAAMIAYRGSKLYEQGLRYELTYNAFPRFHSEFIATEMNI
ncbi:MAG: tRNA (adenosine(37)-N6)-threonylcarbamoyltransferase complex transferase subunit TsaD [Melioribacteraceae bacterium]|nr:tRNA (adenosine(37)-N6)-threonylcarbamoyltransferase complex transferase subunit TsaD [Melioribacteraceae bacterium]MCF8354391.1 tRNA (adenosine(37)-N6)-threonylcarbamoyltransferase complex transferase subunit TsaD [Melioribacteraceae bacterium]MCF8393012.1 tRNA (adenosine(37)-N6)-threonylcarbamoyltransferase complex transferase subunit TsaD [Melioribacteraceae bacterium]MCF8417245.1 tRNA (adenosine(37)-N6)-threonylcarbamoyltransferase complex transferase subunit TsaD [Melioribacteraceae bact